MQQVPWRTAKMAGTGEKVQVSCKERLRLIHLGEGIVLQGDPTEPPVIMVNLA